MTWLSIPGTGIRRRGRNRTSHSRQFFSFWMMLLFDCLFTVCSWSNIWRNGSHSFRWVLSDLEFCESTRLLIPLPTTRSLAQFESDHFNNVSTLRYQISHEPHCNSEVSSHSSSHQWRQPRCRKLKRLQTLTAKTFRFPYRFIRPRITIWTCDLHLNKSRSRIRECDHAAKAAGKCQRSSSKSITGKAIDKPIDITLQLFDNARN